MTDSIRTNINKDHNSCKIIKDCKICSFLDRIIDDAGNDFGCLLSIHYSGGSDF